MKKIECKKSQYHGFYLSNENCPYCPETLSRVDPLIYIKKDIDTREWYTFGRSHTLDGPAIEFDADKNTKP